MQLFIGAVVNMLFLSSMYILVALGFALLFSIMELLHVAHGVIYMVSGYICSFFLTKLGLNQWLAFLLTVLIVSCFGPFLERFCFRPFFRDFDKMLLVGVAISAIVQTTVVLAKGYQFEALPPFVTGIIKWGPITVSLERLVTFLIGGALLLVLVLFINKSKIGLQMQAVAQDLEGALLQGIDVYRVSAIACVIACGLAAVAGGLMGAYLGLGAFMGDYVFTKCLILVVLGGIGSMSGLFLAGLIIGALDAFLPIFLSGSATEALSMGILICILLLRPRGLLGRELA
jgi:branched-chain amino acid transport system permease protein